MQSACKTKPNATDGDTIELPRKLFQTATIASSTSSPSSTKPPSSSTSPSASTSTAASPSSTHASSSSGLSTGASAGIGVGVAIVAIGLIGALIWFLRRRWRRRSSPIELASDSDKSTEMMPTSPQHLASTPLVEADNTDHSQINTKAAGAWRAELPAT